MIFRFPSLSGLWTRRLSYVCCSKIHETVLTRTLVLFYCLARSFLVFFLSLLSSLLCFLFRKSKDNTDFIALFLLQYCLIFVNVVFIFKLTFSLHPLFWYFQLTSDESFEYKGVNIHKLVFRLCQQTCSLYLTLVHKVLHF